jgi:hypothetical protein
MADRVINHAFDQLTKPRFALQETLFGFAPLGHVTSDFGKTEENTLFIANGINDGKCPEIRPVLADTPALAFKTTFSCGNFQRNLWKATLSILVREKARKMLPDDFACLIALQAMGAGIPADDVAFGVQKIERVVNDSLGNYSPRVGWSRAGCLGDG